ncbi:SNF2 family N-terminal domain-containing protein [Flagelloscypha sp. PMI_526]|nr:SNF2 family N-terminal domain-containing protein [Flagelloscypha sp. PMI_526]
MTSLGTIGNYASDSESVDSDSDHPATVLTVPTSHPLSVTAPHYAPLPQPSTYSRDASGSALSEQEDSDDYNDAVHDDVEDDEDDGAYADEEYGTKPKKPRLKKRTKKRSPNPSSRPKPPSRLPSASDSDSDYGARSKKKKRSKPYGDELRLSSRATAKPTNYLDDLDDMHDLEPIADDATYAVDTTVQDGEENDEIELVLGHQRDEEKLNDLEDRFYENIRFNIKWKGFSHLHNTDETYEFLKRFKGLKRVDNYIKTYKQWEARVNHPDITSEEKEQLLLDKERERQEHENWQKVERVISEREVDRKPEYFIKWCNLGYENCTWETHQEVGKSAREHIDAFREREHKANFPFKSKIYPRYDRPKFVKIESDPEYLKATGGELKDFQLTGLNWLAYLWSRGENGILADEMGLGKTVQTVSFISYLFHTHHQYGPFLVIVPLSTITAWQWQFAAWAPDINVVMYTGNAAAREVIRNNEFGSPKKLRMNVLLTTYELVLKDQRQLCDIKWSLLSVDEAHRLKNSESQLYEALMSFNSQSKLLITGTPLQNNVKELLSLMHFLMPDQFALSNEFDLNDEDHEAKIKELHKQLESLMLRRLKRDVLKSLPTKSERILRVEMSGLQTHFYKNILTKNFQGLVKSANGNSNISLLNIAMELKKAANHPYLFDGAESNPPNALPEEILRGLIMNSGKMVLLDKLLNRLRQDGHRVLIFSQMVRMLDILSDYISLRGWPHQRLDGMVSSDMRKKSIAHFNAPGSPDFAFLLSTRAGGLGINLETADTVIIFDSDWNPQNDLQAMARAHRIGQKSHVSVYRLVSKDTMEEDVLERAKKKMVLEYAIINQMDTSQAHLGTGTASSKSGKDTPRPDKDNLSKDELTAVLKYGAQKMFDKDDNQQSQKLAEMDLDDILKGAEDHETLAAAGNTSLGGESFLATFAAVSDVKNDMSWDDIIPLSERQKLEREEDEKKAAEIAAQEGGGVRKRQHAEVSYAGMDADQPVPPPVKKPKPAPQRKSASQKAMELKERDVRVLVRSLQKWGDIHQRYDIIVEESRLKDKNKGLILDVVEEILAECERALKEAEEEKAAKAALGETPGDEPQGESHPRHFVSRCRDLKILYEVLSVQNDPYQWHLPVDNIRPTLNWSGKWTATEDARLLVGAYIYGFGNWEGMAKDAKLGLDGKFFLEEGKKTEGDAANRPIPNAIHLVRRGDYLLGVLREHEEKIRAYEQSMLNRQRSGGASSSHHHHHHHASLPASVRASSSIKRSMSPPMPSSSSYTDGSSKKRKRRPTPTFTDSSSSDECPSMDEATTKEELRPVKKHLKQLKLTGEDMPRDDKVALLKEALNAIGQRIEAVLVEKASLGENTERWRRHLWSFVTLFWPKKVKASKLEEIHAKMVMKATDNTSSGAPGHPAKKPRLSGGTPAQNGVASSASGSSIRSNGHGKHR